MGIPAMLRTGNRIREAGWAACSRWLPGAVDLSAATEAGISEEMAATTAAGAAALTGVVPMAPDADSVEFAAALNAAGAAYLATAAEHVGQRAAFAGAQGLASATTIAAEAVQRCGQRAVSDACPTPGGQVRLSS